MVDCPLLLKGRDLTYGGLGKSNRSSSLPASSITCLVQGADLVSYPDAGLLIFSPIFIDWRAQVIMIEFRLARSIRKDAKDVLTVAAVTEVR